MSDYPSQQTLKVIREWDITINKTRPLIDFILENWWNADCVIITRTRAVFHTCGWSGNEDIIEALRKNYLFWNWCWLKSERGGHYTFEIKEIREDEKVV